MKLPKLTSPKMTEKEMRLGSILSSVFAVFAGMAIGVGSPGYSVLHWIAVMAGALFFLAAWFAVGVILVRAYRE